MTVYIEVSLVLLWAFLMLRCVVAEYQYYQAVKTLEPDLWSALGSPTRFRIPMVFLSPKNAARLGQISNITIARHALRHRRARLHFLVYVVGMLVLGTLFFQFSGDFL